MIEPTAAPQEMDIPEEPASFRFLCQVLREPGNRTADAECLAPRAAMSEAEWRDVLNTATQHGVAPLLHARLCASGVITTLPESVRERLRLSFLGCAARNALLYDELSQIIRLLSQEGIPVIVLKGGFLAATVYDHIGHRSMGDLDLLVPRQQVLAATAAVRRLGYNFDVPGEAPSETIPDLEASIARYRHVPRLFKPPGSGVEMHWNLVSQESAWTVDLEALWSRSRPFLLRDLPVRALAPEDLLLHVCLHAVHGNDIALDIGLRPLCDIAAVVRRFGGELDWARFCARAREWNAVRGAAVTLSVAVQLLGVPVPEECLRALKPSDYDSRWEELARRQVWTLAEGRISNMPVPLKRTLIELGRLVGTPVFGRLRLSFRKVLPSRTEWSVNPTVRPGTPYSWANHRQHTSRMLKRLVQMVAYVARHPGEAWSLVRIFRRDTHFRAWMTQGDPAKVARSTMDRGPA